MNYCKKMSIALSHSWEAAVCEMLKAELFLVLGSLLPRSLITYGPCYKQNFSCFYSYPFLFQFAKGVIEETFWLGFEPQTLGRQLSFNILTLEEPLLK